MKGITRSLRLFPMLSSFSYSVRCASPQSWLPILASFLALDFSGRTIHRHPPLKLRRELHVGCALSCETGP